MLSLTTMMAVNIGLGFLSTIPWTVIFIFTQIFGIRLYYIKSEEECQRIQKRISTSSHTTETGKGYGYSFGRWYAMSLSVSDGTYTCYMVATKKSFELLTKPLAPPTSLAKGDSIRNPRNITVAERCGSFGNVYFRKRELSTTIEPRSLQKTVIEKIIAHYNENNQGTFLLHGPPGSGKSILGILLADLLKGNYCNSLKPWQPGDTLSYLYSDVEPTKEKPLILAFDEFDGALAHIHAGTIAFHKHVPTAVSDKAGWNKMLDEIQRGMFPYLILLLTTNKTPEFIREMDPSYIREGRVDIIFEFAGRLD
jgi:hypothetical protein